MFCEEIFCKSIVNLRSGGNIHKCTKQLHVNDVKHNKMQTTPKLTDNGTFVQILAG